MAEENNNKNMIKSIAREYFEYLGTNLPQQCASDEFYFLPRAEAACRCLHLLDDLNADRIEDHVQYVKKLLRELPQKKVDDLETEIDHTLLVQSMNGFLFEFDILKVWRIDPTLYIKIPHLAIDQILSQEDSSNGSIRLDLLNILQQISPFLDRAVINLDKPSMISLEVSLEMVDDAISFHERDIPAFVAVKFGRDEELIKANRGVLTAWNHFKERLSELAFKNTFAVGEEKLGAILTKVLNIPFSHSDILGVAQEEYKKTYEKMRDLSKTIDPNHNWQDIIYKALPQNISDDGLLELFKKQVRDLRDFFYTHEKITFPAGEKVRVIRTPVYLQSLRATASYRAPLTGKDSGYGIFYLTPGKEDLELIAGHCPYLSAHETYPGHHLLDHFRLHHDSPIRRQFESPIFYEGWASYAELVLDDLDYIQDPRTRLIGLKRQLWRHLRAQLDVELQTNRITLDQAAERIEAIGYSPSRARRQVRRFCLTPGYQLCYSTGMLEILKLKEKYLSGLSFKSFHDIILQNGQIPFPLVEKKIKAFRLEREMVERK